MKKRRSYGEACRFSHALDVVGERWALLIVRELLLGPKRFTDLRHGLSHASTNILAERLKELEQSGVVAKRRLPPPAPASVYELTAWGRELEPVVTQLGAWGARSPFPPQTSEIGSDSIVLALRSLFDPEAADGVEVTVGLRLDEEDFHVSVAAGELEICRGAAEDADAVVEAQPGVFAAILTGELAPAVAVEAGQAEVGGSKPALRRFLGLFPMPEACECSPSDRERTAEAARA
jgi:DNA-binding HxlR family transcriptional regulator/putative sterol carrier protein